jgi:membrane fusion protein, copper/silver efflux system
LYTIADLSEVWVEAELREADAATIPVGAQATVEFAALPGRPFPGTVEYVYPTLEPEARTLKARISVPNPGASLKPGMYATVRLSAPERPALTVPSSAVVDTGARQIVFVDIGGGELSPVDVEIGRTSGDYTEVLSGLEPGQRVVTSAQFLLDSESNLGEVMKSMIGTGGDMGSMDMSGNGPVSGSTVEGIGDKGADMKGMSMPPQER